MKLGKQNAANGKMLQVRIGKQKFYAVSAEEIEDMILDLKPLYGRRSDVIRASLFVLYGLHMDPKKATAKARKLITELNQVFTKRGLVVRGEKANTAKRASTEFAPTRRKP